MTGGTDGLGRAALQKWLESGHNVLLLARNPSKNTIESDRLQVVPCDLSSLSSMKQAVNAVKASTDSIDALVHNAGMWAFSFAETEDGVEQTLQVNVLAPIWLTSALTPLLLKAPAPRVISSASGLHQGSINFEDIEYRSSFSGFKAYRQSKLAIIVWTRYMSRKEPRIFWATQHPGVVNTQLVRDGGWLANAFFRLFGKSPEKGAETLVHLVESPLENLETGEYYKNKRKAKTDTLASYDLRSAPKLIALTEKLS
jgi:NAD(P)-dependent dehydrogenase (short-subunit alcohol dehydrogenase family)